MVHRTWAGLRTHPSGVSDVTKQGAVVFVILYLIGSAATSCMIEFRSMRVNVAQGRA